MFKKGFPEPEESLILQSGLSLWDSPVRRERDGRVRLLLLLRCALDF